MKLGPLVIAGLGIVTWPGPGPARAAERFTKETTVYKQVGTLAIKADVFRFPDNRARPVVVWLHGGALINGHRESVRESVHAFAESNGYVLVSLDYRLAPETKLPAIVEDLEDAFRWLRSAATADRYSFDPDRVVVAGSSAGAYLALVAGHRITPRPRGLLAYFGYGDLIGDWYSKPSREARHNPRRIPAGEAWRQVTGPAVTDGRERQGNGAVFYSFTRQTGLWPSAVTGWDPRREADRFLPYMPLRNVTPGFPPTVLIHGTADTDVPFAQSELMAAEFRRHRVPFQLHPIAGAEHSLAGANPADVSRAERQAFEFLRTQVERR